MQSSSLATPTSQIVIKWASISSLCQIFAQWVIMHSDRDYLCIGYLVNNWNSGIMLALFAGSPCKKWESLVDLVTWVLRTGGSCLSHRTGVRGHANESWVCWEGSWNRHRARHSGGIPQSNCSGYHTGRKWRSSCPWNMTPAFLLKYSNL